MARGQQKIQSQQKNAERQAKLKKAQSSKRAENKALVYSCTVCRVSIVFLSFFGKKKETYSSFVAFFVWAVVRNINQLVKGYLH